LIGINSRTCAALTLLGVGFATGSALAAGKSIEAEPMHEKQLRIDGLLREWGPFTEFGQTISGAGKIKASGMVGYDDKNVYVGFKSSDKKLYRTREYGAKEDQIVLYLAFPGAGGYSTHELVLYPGQPGKHAAAVRRKGAAVTGAKIVEAPVEDGFSMEAQIPWSAFPESARVRVGLRAALRYVDADAGGVRAIVGTSGATSGGELPSMPLEAEQGLNSLLVREKNLPTRAARQAVANVVGDAALERVAVYGGYLTITGHRYRQGKEFYFGELGVRDASMLTRFELRDADGDGYQDIVVQKRFGAPDEYREVLQILKVGSDEVPAPVFTHEVGIKTDEGSVQNKVQLTAGGGGLTIKISQGEAKGFDPGSYAEPKPSNMDSALLPWESVSSRTFAWKGTAFEPVDEARQQVKAGAKPKSGSPGKSKAAPAQQVDAPPPPRPPSADEMLDRVYALYKRERGVGNSKPRFDFVTDVVGDRRPERVLIHEKDIVVFGKGFREATSYALITIGVSDPGDILDATARDLTGDGKAEVIVRAVMHAKASKELGGDTVDRQALLVYSVIGDKLTRVFAAETGRALGKSRVIGSVAFVPQGKGVGIELRPARAVGWTEKTYPFPPDTTAAGGLEPLLLPWGDSSTRKYRFTGAAFTQ
jgi:hypothetical protein